MLHWLSWLLLWATPLIELLLELYMRDLNSATTCHRGLSVYRVRVLIKPCGCVNELGCMDRENRVRSPINDEASPVKLLHLLVPSRCIGGVFTTK